MVGRAACDAAARGEDIVVLLAEELGGRATLDEMGMRRLLTVPPRPPSPFSRPPRPQPRLPRTPRPQTRPASLTTSLKSLSTSPSPNHVPPRPTCPKAPSPTGDGLTSAPTPHSRRAGRRAGGPAGATLVRAGAEATRRSVGLWG